MKKKGVIIGILLFAVTLILVVPLPKGTVKDGGTRDYVALTYRLVRWNKISADGVYQKTRLYPPADRHATLDELWEREGAGNLRQWRYTGEWLDKETAETRDDTFISDSIITEIYADCFFASAVIGTPGATIKFNGTLSEEWCVGDQIATTQTNVYIDRNTWRIEADVLTVEMSDYVPDPYACAKPVIYLYPTKKTDVDVRLDLQGELTCTYPSYQSGWTVTASPDGTLTDAQGKEYNYLYWEGDTDALFDMTKGFCVEGEETAAILETALDKLGLTRREANEFIVYWLPLMENNPYNVISFQEESYTDAAKLTVSPTPDTVIRVFMTWKKSDTFVTIEEQKLTSPARNGFTVVEWGGTEMK